MFAQLYTVHGVYRQTEAVPYVYAYLPDKSKATYKELSEVMGNGRNVKCEMNIIVCIPVSVWF